MPAATGTPEMMMASSTLNRIGEACSTGALIRNHRGTNAAAKTDHQAHRGGQNKSYVKSEYERTEGLVHRSQGLDGQGVGYARAVDSLPWRESSQQGRHGQCAERDPGDQAPARRRRLAVGEVQRHQNEAEDRPDYLQRLGKPRAEAGKGDRAGIY